MRSSATIAESMSLRLLQNATTIASESTPYFERVRYWIDKQQMLLVALEDLAGLSASYFQAAKKHAEIRVGRAHLNPGPKAGAAARDER